MNAEKADAEPAPKEPLETRVAERRALSIAEKIDGNRVLCSSLGRAQAAAALAAGRPESEVTCWFIDQYAQRLALAATQPPEGPRDDKLSIVCSADFPPGPFDLAVLPFSFRGEAELARDLVQDAFARLEIGGHLVVAVDNPRDRWLHDQLREMFPKVTVVADDSAVGYVVRKTAPQRRPRPLRCEFAFRDGERLLRAVSRPGVFAHRRLDPGAHQLIDAVPWPLARTARRGPGLVASDGALRVVDIGCGSGAVGVAIAARGKDAATPLHVFAIDSNARAVDCAAQSAALNGLTTLTAHLDCEGNVDHPATYDVALANPPYYADFRIARLFVDAASRALAPGGTLYIVTKQPAWYQENLFPGWRDTSIRPSGQYFIVKATRG